jgi:hypothetical protein
MIDPSSSQARNMGVSFQAEGKLIPWFRSLVADVICSKYAWYNCYLPQS